MPWHAGVALTLRTSALACPCCTCINTAFALTPYTGVNKQIHLLLSLSSSYNYVLLVYNHAALDLLLGVALFLLQLLPVGVTMQLYLLLGVALFLLQLLPVGV